MPDAALQPEQRATQICIGADELTRLLVALPDLIGDLAALALAALRIPVAVEGLSVNAEDGSPVAEGRVRGQPQLAVAPSKDLSL